MVHQVVCRFEGCAETDSNRLGHLLESKSPAIVEFFNNFQLTADDVSWLAYEVSVNKRDPGEVARDWMGKTPRRSTAGWACNKTTRNENRRLGAGFFATHASDPSSGSFIEIQHVSKIFGDASQEVLEAIATNQISKQEALENTTP